MKYRNEPVIIDGIKFASKAEGKRYTELKILENLGEIHTLQLQKSYVIIPPLLWRSGKKDRATRYVADFVYERDGEIIVEDVKGFRTPVYLLKKKLMKWEYDIEIQEVRR